MNARMPVIDTVAVKFSNGHELLIPRVYVVEIDVSMQQDLIDIASHDGFHGVVPGHSSIDIHMHFRVPAVEFHAGTGSTDHELGDRKALPTRKRLRA